MASHCSICPFKRSRCQAFRRHFLGCFIFLYFLASITCKHSEIPILTHLQHYNIPHYQIEEWEYKLLFGKVVSMIVLDCQMKGDLDKIQEPLFECDLYTFISYEQVKLTLRFSILSRRCLPLNEPILILTTTGLIMTDQLR